MQLIDWLIILLYLILTMGVGLYLARQGSKSLVDFFVSGRSLSWWLAGTSMAATTFSIDTPLYIAGVVATRGIAGNWEWWSFGIAHVILIYVFARLWRRSQIVTDAELTEMRYGGTTAAILRATKAFLFAVPINCIGIGYAMLAMVKVIDALQLWQSLGINPDQLGENLINLTGSGFWETLGISLTPDAIIKLLSVIAISLFVLAYSSFSGLWGVVATDFFQFFLGLLGAIIVAIVAVTDVGGIRELVPNVQQATEIDVLSFLPLNPNFTWNDAAGITATTFSAYIFVQWWAFRRSDGGGEFIQRLAAAKNEAEAEKATWFFNILHYIVRTWPWILVALAAIVLYPNLEDPELGYPTLMLDYLPAGLLGLVVASLIAAFMSTVSTSINWGASYLTNDLYLRFFNPNASQSQLVNIGRIASVLVTILGAIAAFYAQDVRTVFRLVIAIGTGPGLVLILRWFWWRINAAAELTAMIAGFVFGLITTFVPSFSAFFPDFGFQLLFISTATAILWIIVMFVTSPESSETLDQFYLRVRPGGPGWQPQRQRTGVIPEQDLAQDLLKVVAAIFVLFGSMFAIGGFLLLQAVTGFISLVIAVAGGFWLRQLSKRKVRPMPRPGLDDEDMF
ncbi:MAG: sodium:solute symporter family protein [Jaaginema sp. PMC 1079.18]|nr:sodium:solute symporter family protein [Jaaginema sp. PMC 1080.18]MEC4850520.1 sodium:solute symporter family protein [Jaaginema sp. PMC 1079.18]MEC4864777.1 sodium:solute symporter family protein [Jaaginema sp. PMC 1078.18]